MLVTQARTEAERHELKRTQATDKLASLPEATPSEDVIALNAQLVNLTRRAAVMEAQVEVLDGKRKILARFRESLGEMAASLGVAAEEGAELPAADSGAKRAADDGAPGMSRIVLTAQEDLRREIARAMHDGPAQSLTNIVLQAQIVERLVARDPEMARGEVRQLVAMVQQTLDATKSFIFDVRPMVLDDLGLVPTLRRSVRERGQRAGVTSSSNRWGRTGACRWSSRAACSGSSTRRWTATWPRRRITSHCASTGRTSKSRVACPPPATGRVPWKRPSARPPPRQPTPAGGKDLPPALAAMIEDRREQAEAAAESARNAAIVALPATAWREIQQRAATVGISAELLAGGAELVIGVDLPSEELA